MSQFAETVPGLHGKGYSFIGFRIQNKFSNLFQGLAEFLAGGVAVTWVGAGTFLDNFCQLAREPSVPMADGILSAGKPAGVFSG